MKFVTDQSFDTVVEAQNYVSLVALYQIDASRPHERKLPEPYRSVWLSLCGRSPPAAAAPAAKKKGKKGGEDIAEAAAAAPAEGAIVRCYGCAVHVAPLT